MMISPPTPSARNVRMGVFGVAITLFLLSAFISHEPPYWEFDDLFFASGRAIFAAIIVFFAIPRFLDQGQYLVFFGFFLAIVFGHALLEELWLDKLIFPTHSEVYSADFDGFSRSLIKNTLAVVTISALIIFVDSIEARRRNVELERLRKSAELSALQRQLNPHTLLNGLNNIYALSMAGNDAAPKAILGLSDILRYSLYEAVAGPVNLAREAELLDNFIQLQSLGLEDRVEIEFTKNGPIDRVSIEPLLLLPLVENAFKHSAEADEGEKNRLEFKLEARNGRVVFKSQNPVTPESENLQYGGLGLDILRNRLKALYPQRHSLVTRRSGAHFFVRLDIFGAKS